jgi:hypothetical protein
MSCSNASTLIAVADDRVLNIRPGIALITEDSRTVLNVSFVSAATAVALLMLT